MGTLGCDDEKDEGKSADFIRKSFEEDSLLDPHHEHPDITAN